MKITKTPACVSNIICCLMLTVLLMLGPLQLGVSAQQPQVIAPSPVFLTVDTQSGTRRFVIEIADDQNEREVGLMFRSELPQNQGMLFDFGVDRVVTMWMRNTPLSLDMLFIDRAGSIVRIAANTTPFSTDIVPSGQPVRYVLELNAGAAAANGIRPGDQANHPLIRKNLATN